MREVFTALFLFSGIIFILIGCIGVLRLPDPLCRAHALSKALTFGISLMLIGFWIYLGAVLAGLKIALAIIFLFITIPLSGHLFALYSIKGRDSRE